MEKILDKVLEMKEIVNGMKQNCKKMQESFVEWQDQEDAKENLGDTDSTKETQQSTLWEWQYEEDEDMVVEIEEIQKSVMYEETETNDEDKIIKEEKKKAVGVERIVVARTKVIFIAMPLLSDIGKPNLFSPLSDPTSHLMAELKKYQAMIILRGPKKAHEAVKLQRDGLVVISKKLLVHYLFNELLLKVVFKPFDRGGEINPRGTIGNVVFT
ncbi:hypothetical protein CIPAW_04G128100 [Carya illinoinensis]|uniref:Uncharacterized protein n=1 Tax=Carya illinoinensis TaxID=32201 RepID=A0A8T1QUQ2_CARIL|nr:hypothetical protein CIPAW_04G128100 [Carya illinoinensis]